MTLEWTKSGRDWFGIWGQFRAEVKAPDRVSPSPLGFYYWSVRAGDKLGCSGGTSSVQTSKRAAEAEVERLAAKLRKQSA